MKKNTLLAIRRIYTTPTVGVLRYLSHSASLGGHLVEELLSRDLNCSDAGAGTQSLVRLSKNGVAPLPSYAQYKQSLFNLFYFLMVFSIGVCPSQEWIQ